MKPPKPVMAAILAASSAMLASPRPSFAATAADIPSCLKSLQNSDKAAGAVNILTCVDHADPVVEKDIGDRLVSFLFSPNSDGKTYVTDDLRTADPAKDPVRRGLEAEVHAWVKQADANKVAYLYFVMGPGDQNPPWASEGSDKYGLAKFLKPRGPWVKDLEAYLEPWTASKIARTASADDVGRFLDATAHEASTVLFQNKDLTLDQLAARIKQNETTGLTPPTEHASTRNPLDGSGAGFDFHALYEAGAVVRDIQSPGDKGYRRVSMKIFTQKNPDGSTQNMISIVDITPNDPNTPYLPKLIPLTQSGASTFALKDGGRKYDLSVTQKDGDTQISFAREGGKGTAIATSLRGLELARADQAASGGTVSIGGKSYYVLGQGGAHGSVLLFSKSGLDAARAAVQSGAANPAILRPDAMADVSQVDQDGVTVPIPGHPDLGTLDGKPYHLEFDNDLKIWKTVPGKGDQPAPPKTAAAAPGAAPGAGPAPTADRVDAATQMAGWDPGDYNDGFDDQTKQLIRIAAAKASGALEFHAAFFGPAKDWAASEGVGPVVGLAAGSVTKLYGFHSFVVERIVQGGQTTDRFFSVRQFVDLFKQGSTADNLGAMVTSDAGMSMQGIIGKELAAYILSDMMKASDGTVRKFLTNAAAAEKKIGAEYVINGSAATLVLANEKNTYQVLPDLTAPGQVGSNDGLSGLKGPGSVFSLVGGPGLDFPAKLAGDGGSDWVLGAQSADKKAAVYKGTEKQTVGGAAKTVEAWGLMFTFNTPGGMSRTPAPIPVFGDKGSLRMKPPSSYTLGSVPPAVALGSNALIEMYKGSTSAKGAVAVYKYPANDPANAKDPKGRCVAPVLWWGMTADQAKADCPKSSL